MRQSIALVDGNSVADTVTRVHHDTCQTKTHPLRKERSELSDLHGATFKAEGQGVNLSKVILRLVLRSHSFERVGGRVLTCGTTGGVQ